MKTNEVATKMGRVRQFTLRAMTPALLVAAILLPASAGAASFAVMSYNVHGIPFPFIGDRDEEMYDIAEKLEDFHTVAGPYAGMLSVVGLQEVFANKYYNILTDPQVVSYAYVTDKDMRGDLDVGDGLTLLSDFSLGNLVRTQWERCNGTIDEDGSDCDAPKGFTFTEVTLEPNVTFHLYTLHADSGQGLEDQDVRRANIDQLIAAINANSPEGTAVIVLGDTNSLYTRAGTDNIQDLLAETGVKDVWVELRRAGMVPGPGPEIEADCETTPSTGNCEEVDKIFYRDGATLAFVPKSYQVLRTMFMGTITPLSDHDPVAVKFDYAAVTSTTTTPPTSTTIPSTTTTTMIGEGACGDPISDNEVAASDALFVLRSAVGNFACALCTCDANGSASLSATDSLIVLKFAVGQEITLDCPPCEGVTATTTTIP